MYLDVPELHAIMQQSVCEQRIEESRELSAGSVRRRGRGLETLRSFGCKCSPRYISGCFSDFRFMRTQQQSIFRLGMICFRCLVRELKQAKKYIFIEYFIINDGVMWQTILDILEQKAAEGVDVRLIYDGFGCLTTLTS